MKIENSISKLVPEFWYDRVMNNKVVHVEVATSTEGHFVGINGIIMPISDQEYYSYYFEYNHLVHPDKEINKELAFRCKVNAAKFRNDPYLKVFWMNASHEFEKRMESGIHGGSNIHL